MVGRLVQLGLPVSGAGLAGGRLLVRGPVLRLGRGGRLVVRGWLVVHRRRGLRVVRSGRWRWLQRGRLHLRTQDGHAHGNACTALRMKMTVSIVLASSRQHFHDCRGAEICREGSLQQGKHGEAHTCGAFLTMPSMICAWKRAFVSCGFCTNTCLACRASYNRNDCIAFYPSQRHDQWVTGRKVLAFQVLAPPWHDAGL